MPDTTFLHIQGRDSDPTSVLALPASGVRVGRGVQCEVRLHDPSLSEVQCIVRPRGDTWHVQPVGPSANVTIEGQAVDHLRVLPLGIPLIVGSYRLVLRPTEWGTYQSPIEVGPTATPRRSVEPDRPAAGATEAEVERLRRWQARLEQRERWLKDRQEEKKWEAKWKAAGEGIRARSAASAPLRPDTTPPNPPLRPDPVRPTVARPRPVPRPSEVERPTPVQPPSALIQAEESPAPVGPPSIPIAGLAFEDDLGPIIAEATRSARDVAEPPDMPLPPGEGARRAGEGSPTDAEIPLADPLPAEERTSKDPAPIEPDQDSPGDPREPEAPAEPRIAARVAPPSRVRPESEPQTRPDPIPSADGGEYPSARAIFAAQGSRPVPDVQTKGRRRVRRGPMPTDPREPSQWTLPAWLAAPPTFLVAAGCLGVGAILSLYWTRDNLDAGLAARAALRPESGPPVPIDPAIPPETRWWRTTAGHMAHWAAAIERSPDAADRAEQVGNLLHSAELATPLQREVRYTLGQPAPGEEPAAIGRALGLSRDVVSLTLAGRSLKRAGKPEAAIRAYRRALELAAGASMERLDPPTFDDDATVRRYRLPHEALAGTVVRDMIAAGGWTFADWSRALPLDASVRLAAARILREGASPDADRAVDLVLAAEIVTPDRPTYAAEHHAAQAEAMAFKDRKAEAADRYRSAIEMAGDDATRRRWRLGLAEILAPLGATKERAEMLEAAKGPDPGEEVTRKALDAQKFAGLR